MTRKDYRILAGVLAEFPGPNIPKASLVRALGTALRAENEFFDPVAFVAACEPVAQRHRPTQAGA